MKNGETAAAKKMASCSKQHGEAKEHQAAVAASLKTANARQPAKMAWQNNQREMASEKQRRESENRRENEISSSNESEMKKW
jgi:hypothetical protein